MTRIRNIGHIGLVHDLPESAHYASARTLSRRRVANVIHVETDDGVDGLGEAWGPPSVIAGYMTLLREAFIGTDVHDHTVVWRKLHASLYHLGAQNGFVACWSGLNVALYDIKAKLAGVALHKLLWGAEREAIPVYLSGGYFTRDPEAGLARSLERMTEIGGPAAKIKIGRSPEDDLARASLARNALGDEVELLVDANGNYTPQLALASMERVAGLGIGWYEEPLPPSDLTGYGWLRARAPVAVATGEAHYMAEDFHHLLAGGCSDVLQPDITLCGGLDELAAVVTLARVHNAHVSPHVWGGAIGLVTALHALAGMPAGPHSHFVPRAAMLEYDIGENALRDELLTERLAPINGCIAVPHGPGLGVDLDPEAVARYRVTP